MLGGRLMSSMLHFHLSFPDHMHRFDAGQDDAGTTKILEAHHRFDDPFDGPVVLLNNVVQILKGRSA